MAETKPISLSTTIKQIDKILVQNLDEDTVMANIDSGFYFGVNQNSKRVWELVASPVTISDICRQLQEEYEVDAATCETEVLGFVREMISEGLVEVV